MFIRQHKFMNNPFITFQQRRLKCRWSVEGKTFPSAKRARNSEFLQLSKMFLISSFERVKGSVGGMYRKL